jgi:hypothetical protein
MDPLPTFLQATSSMTIQKSSFHSFQLFVLQDDNSNHDVQIMIPQEQEWQGCRQLATPHRREHRPSPEWVGKSEQNKNECEWRSA